MFQKITFLLTLMSSGIVACIAAEPGNIQSDSIVMNSFEVGEIPDLGHPVCTLSLANNKKVDFYNYVEGDICPPDGRNCTYTAIMKLNGEIAILKQISPGENNSVYRNSNFYISIKQTPMTEPNNDEGGDVKATIVLKTKHSEKILNMTGYCRV
ncbi:adhesin [Citrobacter koseri]|uniref:adhesin n=1 Tax=Citrobacter koseri TaxID=545 RepID=UPI0023B14E95|nr:adhesin [Citrobacter koseri]EKU0540654.1 adhesin [Citrobacter koseri]EKU8895596.1 adhesin [Citrobacter koseri]HEM6797756.1 adhesin [Citrobacter koseri]HEM6828584.1 adhesin [Citrobacter koseri]HEM6879200.1 adhesin [Citrobacter koseri]